VKGFLKNLRVRSRLMALIAIPTISAIGLGGFIIASSLHSALVYQRVKTLAAVGQRIAVLAQALEDERDQTVAYIAMNATFGGRAAVLSGSSAKAAPELTAITQTTGTTNRAAAQLRALAGQIGSSYSLQARQAAAKALTALGGLPYLRALATRTQLPVLVVVQKYTQVINDVLALDDQIAQPASDPTLAQTVQALRLVSAMQEAASEQRAIVVAALLEGAFGPGQLDAVQAAQSAWQDNLAAFDIAASVDQQRLFNTSVDRSFVYLANSEELQAISEQAITHSLKADPTSPADWYGAMSNIVDIQMGSVERQLAAAAATRASELRGAAIVTALLVGLAVVLILLTALTLTVLIGRSMVRPLRRLRAGALEVAGVQLPEAVRQLSESDGTSISLDAGPIDIDSADEIGDVARAFDQVHREALRLAANEAALRGNVNAMFRNLSRRTQSLVERLIRLIDGLEQGEQDADRLGNLFQMDHLATRMRRNSENLLVLAGHESSRHGTQPVPLVDVIRAAISEIEQYERLTPNVQSGIAVRGPAVHDVIHLIAELAENATSFSRADASVSISGHLLSSGGALLDITDRGVGMGSEELAHANWRLDNPPVVDVAVSRRMGLFVVGRLAARHGIRVRLRAVTGAGLTALVWLPDEVIAHDGIGSPGGPGRHAEQVARSATGPATDSRPTPGDWTDARRLAVEDQVAAARAPRFTPLPSEGGDETLGPQQVAGAGPHPGRAHETPAGLAGPVWSTDSVPAAPEWSVGPDQPAAPDWHPHSAEPAQDAHQARVLSAPVAGVPAFSGTFQAQDDSPGSADGDAIVPSAVSLEEGNSLPIFEAVESDWFRRGRRTPDRIWTSPADDGWRAAEAAAVPASRGVTSAKLPKRVPQANLIPGTVAEVSVPTAVRSPAATRERFASLQRGMREARAAGGIDKIDGTNQDVPDDS
jgi:signal transduction histidine kinase